MGKTHNLSPQRFGRFAAVLCLLILAGSRGRQGWGALSGRTERARGLISRQHFPTSEPAMDARQQFIVFSPDSRLSRELLGELLGLRQRVYRFFGVSKVWDQPAFVLIFPSKEKYGLTGSGGSAIQFRYHGEDVRIIGSYLQEGLRERILPHEMVHFLIKDLSAAGAAGGGEPPQLPVFIEEGIVEYFAAIADDFQLCPGSLRERDEAAHYGEIGCSGLVGQENVRNADGRHLFPINLYIMEA